MSNFYQDDLILSAIEKYGDTIYRLALHYVKSAADAEDVVQEVLFSYIRHTPSEEREKAWLLRVTVNKCLNVLKKRRKEVQASDIEPAAEPPPMNAELYEALETLSVLDRKIIFLHFHAGYSEKEIGKLVHKSHAAVRKRLERAKKKLKNFLEEEE